VSSRAGKDPLFVQGGRLVPGANANLLEEPLQRSRRREDYEAPPWAASGDVEGVDSSPGTCCDRTRIQPQPSSPPTISAYSPSRT
jgi:hypothetical protein